ncbi:MAG: hypothetical protein QOE06_2222, partial [Thermoleophilaceae bacterium]|nr:hypothetical protein [Thermoleophilaceae bacterium]
MALPADPAAFVLAAEQGINEYDLDATAGVYAPDGRLENYVDGAFEGWDGADQVRAAWAAYLDAMRERRFSLRKTLVSAADDTIVNTWTGSLGGRTDAEGIEYWRFGEDGRVREHRMYSLMNVKPATSPLARLRMAAAYPLSARA